MRTRTKVLLGILVLLLVSFVSFFWGTIKTQRKYERIIEELETQSFDTQTFYATIDKVDGNYIDVTGLQLNDINHRWQFGFLVEDSTSVTWNNQKITTKELQEGHVIAITYTGSVQETSPAWIEEVIKVQLLTEELKFSETDPWVRDVSLPEAEELAGFRLELPEIISNSYVSTEYEAIKNEVIKVTYVDEEYEVIIHRVIGENQYYMDNSVSYLNVHSEEYEGSMDTYTVMYFSNEDRDSRILISGNGYSWTIHAPNGYRGDSVIDFIHEICR